MVAQAALDDVLEGPVKDTLISVLADPKDLLPHSHLLKNGHVCGSVAS